VTQTVDEAVTRSRRRALNRTLTIASQLGGPLVLVALVVVFSVTLSDTFPTHANFESMIKNQAVPGILALGLLFPLVCGEFDFSGGTVATGSAVALVVLTGEHGLSWPVACLVILAAAALVGVVNGVLVAYFEYSSFVATLAVSGVLGGAALWQSKGQTLFKGVPEGFIDLGRKSALGIPYPALYLLAAYVLVAFVLRGTAWGRYHDSVGKGRAAARLAGVPVRRHVFQAFVASAVLAGVAGLVLVARLGSAPPSAGEAFTLSAFAAAFLGATMIRPGSFNATGTVVAILLIAVGINGLLLAGVENWIERIFTGGVLLVAVGLSRLERLTR
jgi:ribose transport system permease protein